MPPVLDKDPDLRRRFYGQDPRVLVRQRNDTGVSRAVGRVHVRGAEVDQDRPRLTIDVTLATAITTVEAGEEEIVIKIVVPIGDWIDRIEVQPHRVFCKCDLIIFIIGLMFFV